MSISNKLNLIKQDIINARNSIVEMRGHITENGGTASLSEDIKTIPATIGVTREISEDGVYQIPETPTTFSIPSNAIDIGEMALRYGFYNSPELRGVDLSSLKDVSGGYALESAFYTCNNVTEANFENLEDITGNYALSKAFYQCENIKNVDFKKLKNISAPYALDHTFYYNFSLENLNLSSLEYVDATHGMNYTFCKIAITDLDLHSLIGVGGTEPLSTTENSYAMTNCFVECEELENIDLRNLRFINAYGMNTCFSTCTKLKSIDLSSLYRIYNSGMTACFRNCTSLESISFPSLNEIHPSSLSTTFSGCTSLKNIYFPKLWKASNFAGNTKSHMNNMLSGVNGCTVHFPSNTEAAVKNYTFFKNGFGGTNTIILYDLPEGDEEVI